MKRALESVTGVKSASVDFAEKKATVLLDDPAASASQLLESLSKEGFSGHLDRS